MTARDEELERLERAYVEAGYDLTLLEANLRLTPEERIRAHEDARRLAEALRAAVDEYHERLSNPDSEPR